MNEAPPQTGPPSFTEALRFWIKLGWISFGGPAGQIAIMHKEIVERRRWMGEEHFLHALNFCMLLPGPEAQQLATYLGWRLHGARGGIAAGVLFVLPSVIILWALSWLYMTGGEVPWIKGIFHGLMPAVIAIVISAARRIGAKALKTPGLWAIAVLSFISIFALKISFIWIILAAAGIGLIGARHYPAQFPAGMTAMAGPENSGDILLPAAPRSTARRTMLVSALCLCLWWLPVVACGLLSGWKGIHFQEGLFFSKTALITVGGAYAVLPYVAQTAVESHGWLSQGQMMAGLGLAETTPGPLIMVLQFVGFVAAWQNPGELAPLAAATMGAAITTWVTFLPSFLFVFLGAHHVEKLRERPVIASMLTAITAAVTGVILNLAIWFAWHALRPGPGMIDWFVAITCIAALISIERFKLGVIPVLAACALLGGLLRMH